MIHTHPSLASQCPRCGDDNRCAPAAGHNSADCWCMAQAPRAEPASDWPAATDRCLCVACLQALRSPDPPSPEHVS
ncbi:MAG: cysteine-rich CWC family protein [Spongiibacteraceae bacterium]|nr:cysteine-rich CWC family protein [Spongiibacteraceae bacterium]